MRTSTVHCIRNLLGEDDDGEAESEAHQNQPGTAPRIGVEQPRMEEEGGTGKGRKKEEQKDQEEREL